MEEAKEQNKHYSDSDLREVLKERLEKLYESDKNYQNGPDDSSRPHNLSFLDDPVDECMSKSLFRRDDPLMKFYEAKYKIEIKDCRPFT